MHSNEGDRFAAKISKRRSSLLEELGAFMLENRKWWLLPVLAAVLVLGAALLLGGTAVAPFIYTLF